MRSRTGGLSYAEMQSGSSNAAGHACNIRIHKRKQRLNEPLHHSDASYKNKIEKLKQIVNNKKQLASNMKMKLMHHLTLHLDEFEIPEQNDPEETEEELSDLFEIYIPEFVNKSQQSQIDEQNIDEVTKEVESVEYPLSAPTTEPITQEYIERKTQAITKLVEENIELSKHSATTIDSSVI